MKRRTLFTSFAGTLLSALSLGRVSQAQNKDEKNSHFIDVELGKQFDLSMDSTPLDVTEEWRKNGFGRGKANPEHREKISPIHLNWGVLTVSRGKRLTGLIDADLRFVKDVDYWVSVAVFDDEKRLLGAAVHHEPLELNGGFIEKNGKRFNFDFGVSAAFENTKWISVAISDRQDLEMK
jgi:hypothetical protein